MPRIARHRTLRIAGWTAAYALALQALLFAFASAINIPAGAVGMANAAELCRGGEPSDGAPDDPAHPLRDHCIACFFPAAATPPPHPAASPVRYAVAIASLRPLATAPESTGSVRHPGLPRGPPAAG